MQLIQLIQQHHLRAGNEWTVEQCDTTTAGTSPTVLQPQDTPAAHDSGSAKAAGSAADTAHAADTLQRGLKNILRAPTHKALCSNRHPNTTSSLGNYVPAAAGCRQPSKVLQSPVAP